MVKVLQIINSCKVCPKRCGHDCSLVGTRIVNLDQIAAFCPLTDYPAGVIAQLEQTLARYTGVSDDLLERALMTVISKRTGSVFTETGCGVILNTPDGSVILQWDSIQRYDAPERRLYFCSNNENYYLSFGREVELYKFVTKDIDGESRELVQHIPLNST